MLEQNLQEDFLRGRGLSAIANLKIQEETMCGEVLMQVSARRASPLWNQAWNGLVVFTPLQ